MRRWFDKIIVLYFSFGISLEMGCPDGPPVSLDVVRRDGDSARLAAQATFPRLLWYYEAIVGFIRDACRPGEVGVGVVQRVNERTSYGSIISDS